MSMEMIEAKEFFADDEIGRMCIELAAKSQTKQNFGAVLIAHDEVIGTGRNHRSTPEERAALFGIDYAVHAEEAALLDSGLATNPDQTLYVIGRINSGKDKGALNIRTTKNLGYTCLRCAKKLVVFDTTVAVPTLEGWRHISPEGATQEARDFRASQSQRNFN